MDGVRMVSRNASRTVGERLFRLGRCGKSCGGTVGAPTHEPALVSHLFHTRLHARAHPSTPRSRPHSSPREGTNEWIKSHQSIIRVATNPSHLPAFSAARASSAALAPRASAPRVVHLVSSPSSSSPSSSSSSSSSSPSLVVALSGPGRVRRARARRSRMRDRTFGRGHRRVVTRGGGDRVGVGSVVFVLRVVGACRSHRRQCLVSAIIHPISVCSCAEGVCLRREGREGRACVSE